MKVSIVVPTRNESENVKPLMEGIATNMGGIDYEVLVVDDSDDDRTVKAALESGARVVSGQHKGLGQAIIDGINVSMGRVVLVMDADGQHSPNDIPKLLKPILNHGIDFVVGSRYVKGGDASGWARSRRLKSQIGTYIMYPFVGVQDANSGFFAFRRNIVDTSKLNHKTWKIMLEVLFKGRWMSKLEVPITFGDRYAGESKRSAKQVRKDAANIARLVIGKYSRFVKFALVGGVGNIWHFGLLWVLTEYAGLWYGLSALIAMGIAMTSNYILHNYWTFKDDKPLSRNMFNGWLKFGGGSAIGDSLQWVLLIVLTQWLGIWYMLSSGLATIFTVFFKYTVSRKWIWGSSKPKRLAIDADYEWVSFYKGLPWQKRWKQKLARIARGMVGEAGSVLEIGCGSSPLGVLVNHNDYIGIDRNEAKIEYMTSKNLRDCQFAAGDCNSLYLKGKSFDTILFIEVIEHLDSMDDARNVLKSIYQLLKDNGQAIIATPNYGSWTGRWQDRLYGIFQKGAYKEEHKIKFDLSSLIKLCKECGLEYEYAVIPMGADMVCKFVKRVHAN